MRAFVASILFFVSVSSPATAQQPAPIRNAYVIFSSDPLDLASALTQHFATHGINARAFESSSFNHWLRTRHENASPGTSAGSAFFIDDNGTLITNHHVVEGRPHITVSPPGGDRIEARVLASSPSLDVAVLAARNYRPERYLDIGSATDSPVGQRILAIGYPLSDVLSGGAKVTDGIVSSLSGLGDDASLIQVSIPIQPGNSGGPIVLPDARAVAIAVARLDDEYAMRRYGAVPQNVNFAIKIDFARPLFSQFLRVTDPSRKAANIEQAAAATVLVEASAAPRADTSPRREANSVGGREITARFRYDWFRTTWTPQLVSLEITVDDLNSGELLARFTWSGRTWTGARNFFKQAFQELDRDLGLAPANAR